MTDTNKTVAERIHALHKAFGGRAPVAVQAEIGDASVLPAGATMPDGELLDVHGAPTTLTAARRGNPAVVVTYRGAWCPYCNVTLHAYQEQLVPVLAERGIELVAISPQKPDGSLSMTQKNELSFTVLSDPGNRIAERLGVLTAPGPAERRIQNSLGIDLTRINADGTDGLPMPTVVLVDSEGVIRWIDVHPDYTTRTEIADIIDALDLLG
ncbi:AhpC/TSA family protein [Nocardia colli]|uniref:thioredoxin-dependent peroxiredoxin n=2 Tax=Nocardia colli TaxID=2545717 RepID=A0A5N0DWB2_9NOCA|nr:AhpC/TSA family protein [Nocardia colli]